MARQRRHVPPRRSALTPVLPSPGSREEERRILELTGYCQSVTVGVAPIVVVIASVATFSAHMLLGYDLTAAQVPDSRQGHGRSQS